MNTNQYTAATNAEVVFRNDVREGAKGMAARRVQDGLGHHGFRTGINGNFEPATATAVKKFQTHIGTPRSLDKLPAGHDACTFGISDLRKK